MLLQSLKNSKGFTLVEVMIGAAILGGIALVLVQVSKDQANSMIKSKVSTDLGQFKSEIITMFGLPTNCNANVGSLSVTPLGSAAVVNTPAFLSSCTVRTTGGCLANVNRVSRFPVVTGTNWKVADTKISDRVRIKAIAAVLEATTGVALSAAKFTIDLETRPNLARITPASAGATVDVIQAEKVEITVPVVMSGATILGCPKSWNSTVPF